MRPSAIAMPTASAFSVRAIEWELNSVVGGRAAEIALELHLAALQHDQRLAVGVLRVLRGRVERACAECQFARLRLGQPAARRAGEPGLRLVPLVGGMQRVGADVVPALPERGVGGVAGRRGRGGSRRTRGGAVGAATSSGASRPGGRRRQARATRVGRSPQRLEHLQHRAFRRFAGGLEPGEHAPAVLAGEVHAPAGSRAPARSGRPGRRRSTTRGRARTGSATSRARGWRSTRPRVDGRTLSSSRSTKSPISRSFILA